MTPFSVWSESRSEMPDLIHSGRFNSLPVELDLQLQEDLCHLVEELIQNLMSSSATQLRKVLGLMEQSQEEKRQRDHDTAMLRELAKIEEKTTAIVAEALVPVLNDLQRSRMVDEFASILKKILPEFAGQTVIIKAPDHVHEKISRALRRQSIEAELLTNDGAEIVVAGNNVVLRADLDHWVQKLNEVAAP